MVCPTVCPNCFKGREVTLPSMLLFEHLYGSPVDYEKNHQILSPLIQYISFKATLSFCQFYFSRKVFFFLIWVFLSPIPRKISFLSLLSFTLMHHFPSLILQCVLGLNLDVTSIIIEKQFEDWLSRQSDKKRKRSTFTDDQLRREFIKVRRETQQIVQKHTYLNIYVKY